MKIKLAALLSLSLLIANTSFLSAQTPTEVKEIPQTQIGEKNGNSLYVSVYRTKEKAILKALRTELKKKDSDVKIKAGLLSATSVIFPEVSSDTIRVYAKTKDVSETENELYVLFMNKTTSISSTSDVSGFIAAKAFVHEFANQLSKESSETFYKKRAKELVTLKKKLKAETKAKAKAEKTIVKYKKKLVSNEFDLKQLLDAKESPTQEIVDKRNKLEKSIVNYNKKIKDLEIDIVESEKTKNKLTEEIEQSKKDVQEAKKAVNVFK